MAPEPIAMFNALWLHANGGEDRYAEYGAAVLPILADVGADLLTPFMPTAQALEGGFDPTMVGFVRYPSAGAFDQMWHSDAYAEAAPLRRRAATRAVLTRCAIDPVDGGPCDPSPGIVVLNMLWFRAGGRARYDEYLAASEPLVHRVGGRLLSPRFLPETAYDDDVVPDLILLGNYPSIDALWDLIDEEGYEDAARLRADALQRSVTTVLHVGD